VIEREIELDRALAGVALYASFRFSAFSLPFHLRDLPLIPLD
jgi:hypothetical protein